MNDIERLEQAWKDAYLAGDTARLGALLAEEVLFVLPGSDPMGKAEAASISRSSGVRYIRYDIRGIEIRQFGETAVVFGRMQRTRMADGNRTLEDWRFTKVYARRDGRWQVVSFHASE